MSARGVDEFLQVPYVSTHIYRMCHIMISQVTYTSVEQMWIG